MSSLRMTGRELAAYFSEQHEKNRAAALECMQDHEFRLARWYDGQADAYSDAQVRLEIHLGVRNEHGHAALNCMDPWSCCGEPVKVVGLDVVCTGRCGRRSR